MLKKKGSMEDSQRRLPKHQQQPWLLLLSTFVRKLILEVCGAAGAVWGFSECVGLRTNENVWFWRHLSLSVFVIFFIQWLRHLQRNFQRDQMVCCCDEEAGRVVASTKDLITYSTDATTSTLLSRESSLSSFSKGEEDEITALMASSFSPLQGTSGRSMAAAEPLTVSSYQTYTKERPKLMYSMSSIEMTSDTTPLSPPLNKPLATPAAAATTTTSAASPSNSHYSSNHKLCDSSGNRRDFRRRHTLEIA